MAQLDDFLRDAYNGKEKAVRKFLDNNSGAVDATEGTSMTALMKASWEGHKDVVALLLERGAMVDKQTDAGWTALMYAAWRGQTEVAELLLEKGAGIDIKNTNHGGTALMIAASDGYTDTVALLLQNGASITEKNHNDKTAPMLAGEEDHADVVRLIRDWSEKMKREEKKKQEQWLADTDFSKGLKKPMRVLRPFTPSR